MDAEGKNDKAKNDAGAVPPDAVVEKGPVEPEGKEKNTENGKADKDAEGEGTPFVDLPKKSPNRKQQQYLTTGLMKMR